MRLFRRLWRLVFGAPKPHYRVPHHPISDAQTVDLLISRGEERFHKGRAVVAQMAAARGVPRSVSRRDLVSEEVRLHNEWRWADERVEG